MFDENSAEYLEAAALAEEVYPNLRIVYGAWPREVLIDSYREVFIRGYLAALER